MDKMNLLERKRCFQPSCPTLLCLIDIFFFTKTYHSTKRSYKFYGFLRNTYIIRELSIGMIALIPHDSFPRAWEVATKLRGEGGGISFLSSASLPLSPLMFVCLFSLLLAPKAFAGYQRENRMKWLFCSHMNREGGREGGGGIVTVWRRAAPLMKAELFAGYRFSCHSN